MAVDMVVYNILRAQEHRIGMERNGEKEEKVANDARFFCFLFVIRRCVVYSKKYNMSMFLCSVSV